MDDLERLVAIEEIRRVKARYCRVMDEKKWEEWREVLTPDAVMLVPDGPEIVGVEAILDFVSKFLQSAETVHHIHAPEIDVLSEIDARGIWALDETVLWPSETASPLGCTKIRVAGHYREKYRRTNKGWRISELTLCQVPLDQC